MINLPPKNHDISLKRKTINRRNDSIQINMKLKEFSTTGIKSLKGIATITFTKSGCISFNRKAVETIGLKAGDKLIFFQDEENPKDWYMKISEDKGAELRATTSGNGGLVCNFAVVAQNVFTSTGTSSRVKFQILTHPDNDMYAIITKNEI